MSHLEPRSVLWRHADFVRLWSAQAISTFGARIARTGLPFAAVLSLHATAFQLGILGSLTLAPGVFVGLFAGAAVDRLDRRLLMIWADLLRGAILLTVPLFWFADALSVWDLYAAAAIVGGASALFDIADHAYLPNLIGTGPLVEGNAKLAVTESVAEIGGPALAGPLIQIFTAPVAIGFNAITYFGSAVLLATIAHREPRAPRPRERQRWYAHIGLGLTAIFENPLVRPLFLMAVCAPVFEGFFVALYSLYGLSVLHLSAATLGLIIGVGGIGALAGASLSRTLCRTIGIGPTIVSGLALSALSAFCIPLARQPMWFAISMLVISQLFGDSLAVAAAIPASSLRQTVLPSGILGRTGALFRAAGGATGVAGALLGGMLGVVIGARSALFLSAAGLFATTMIGVLSPLAKVKEIPAAVP